MKKYLLGFLVSVLAIFVVGCGADEEESNDGNEVAAEEESQTVTVEHELGTTEVEKNPEKVIVFDFGSLDTLDKLGVDVAGVPQMNIPSYLEKFEGDEYENIGGDRKSVV